MNNDQDLTRRSFLARTAVLTSCGATLARPAFPVPTSSTYIDLIREPNCVKVYANLSRPIVLSRSATRWSASGVELSTEREDCALKVSVLEAVEGLTHIHVRWESPLPESLWFLGDQWERSYGDLGWRTMTPERVMPWYFSTYDGESVHGYGVETGAGALCFWQADPVGVSLWLDISNGGGGVDLAGRQLHAATVVTRKGQPGEDALSALGSFCRRMCKKPRLIQEAIYGTNDWYYAYGESTPEAILQDAELASELRPQHGPSPFTVVDGGWEDNSRFPDMQQLADAIRGRGVRPGIWVRVLQAAQQTNAALLMPDARMDGEPNGSRTPTYDPTVPDGLEAISQRLAQLKAWGYEFVKHDFSTYDLLGQWGNSMGPRLTVSGWSFHDKTKTNAEIISALYEKIRGVLGQDVLVLGCNTIGHLGAGIFDLQRIGDDTGLKGNNADQLWERIRRIGVNSVSFRLPQHRHFFVVDGDCVPVTGVLPWQQGRQWLDFIASSGTALFVSVEKRALGSKQKRALAAAFEIAASKPSLTTATDWFQSTTPGKWSRKSYSWCTAEGSYPFSV
jgi:alpha-galactosidase